MIEKILNFILRGLLGVCSIFLINHFVIGTMPEYALGINGLTFLTSGMLGFPGVLALYGIKIYMII